MLSDGAGRSPRPVPAPILPSFPPLPSYCSQPIKLPGRRCSLRVLPNLPSSSGCFVDSVPAHHGCRAYLADWPLSPPPAPGYVPQEDCYTPPTSLPRRIALWELESLRQCSGWLGCRCKTTIRPKLPRILAEHRGTVDRWERQVNCLLNQWLGKWGKEVFELQWCYVCIIENPIHPTTS